ncbi:uncharacterized [Tachysurus ichikawai]
MEETKFQLEAQLVFVSLLIPYTWLYASHQEPKRGGDGGTLSTPRCPLWVASERREVQTEGLMLPWDSPQEEALFSGSHFHAGSIITSAREEGRKKIIQQFPQMYAEALLLRDVSISKVLADEYEF